VSAILDASALLAFLRREPGAERVADLIAAGASICTANLAEVMAVLVRDGIPVPSAAAILTNLPIDVVDLTLDLALCSGALIALTRRAGLSFGDRVCLALAKRDVLPAVTADTAWTAIADAVGVEVRLIR
jgi:ribonuclease VapC